MIFSEREWNTVRNGICTWIVECEKNAEQFAKQGKSNDALAWKDEAEKAKALYKRIVEDR